MFDLYLSNKYTGSYCPDSCYFHCVSCAFNENKDPIFTYEDKNDNFHETTYLSKNRTNFNKQTILLFPTLAS